MKTRKKSTLTYETVDAILVAFLIARGHQVHDVKRVWCECDRCRDAADRQDEDPDCFAQRTWAVFVFVDSPDLLEDMEDFEMRSSSDTLWAEVINQSSAHVRPKKQR